MAVAAQAQSGGVQVDKPPAESACGYATLEPGEDKDVHLRWEFMEDEEVVVDFRSPEYIGAAQGEVDWEEYELRMTREQFERVFGGKGKLRLTVDVRPEA